jgi:hypothetical protein
VQNPFGFPEAQNLIGLVPAFFTGRRYTRPCSLRWHCLVGLFLLPRWNSQCNFRSFE